MITAALPPRKVSATISTQELFDLQNLERQHAGVQPLKLNSALAKSAQAKAQVMMDSDCWSHNCPPAKSPWDYFVAAGYTYIYAGENLAEGECNDQNMMTAWMNSPSHRENILKPQYTEVGFGVVTGRFQGMDDNTIVVVHFGTEPKKEVQHPLPDIHLILNVNMDLSTYKRKSLLSNIKPLAVDFREKKTG